VLGTFGPIALFLVVAVIFPVIPLFLSRFLALYALMFVIFDVEVIYLFPWALVYDKLPVIAAVEMAVFIMLLLVGLAYAWRKRAFEWQ
jgi:NADH:ubiquinone oxidoreductase subunit 3 (subunit A)